MSAFYDAVEVHYRQRAQTAITKILDLTHLLVSVPEPILKDEVKAYLELYPERIALLKRLLE